MAAETERLIAQRTALLARVQSAREQQKRLAMISANQALAATIARRDAAEQAVADAAINRARRLRERYDSLAGKPVAIDQIRRLEESLVKAQKDAKDALQSAETLVKRAEDELKTATIAFREASQRTRKRDRMADEARRRFRNAESLAEETALEEELTDTRAAATAGRG